MKVLIRFTFFLVFFISAFSSVAQLAGTYTVPGSFSNLASAINSLNIGGVVGPVTINIQAGYIETVTTGGYSLYAVPGASSLNTITFGKTGTGSNPNFISYAGNRYAYQNIQDGLWRLIGADYITISNLSFTDNRTSNPNTMEFGISMLRANAYDGCQYNTIRNCTFSLKRENNDAGSGIGAAGSRAIEITGASTQNHTLAISPLSISGSHRFNVISGNYIQNCNYCIALTSSYSPQSSPYMDADNTIGGSTVSQGNTISGYGTSTFPGDAAGGIYYEGQQRLSINSNSISSLPTTGFVHTNTDLYGIRGKNNNYDISITNNTLSVKNGSLSLNLYAIRNEGLSSFPLSNTLRITGNRFVNCQGNYQYSNSFHGILNSANVDTLIISSNSFTQNTTFCQDLVSLIRNTAPVQGIYVNNNILSISAAQASTVNLIYHSGSAATGQVSISDNLIKNLTLGNGTASYQSNLISILGLNRTLSINSNTFQALTYDNTGTSYFILNNSGTSTNVLVDSNAVTGYTATQFFYGHQIYFYRGNNTTSLASSTVQISNNSISNFAGVGSSFYGITTSEGPSLNCSRKLIFNNRFTNLSTLSNFRGVDAVRLGDANGSGPSAIFNNTIMNVFGGNYCAGIDVSLPTGSLSLPPEIRSNVIYSLSAQTTNTGGLWGIRATTGGGLTISGNIVSNIANTTTFTCDGINVYSAAAANDVVNIYNNIVAHVKNSGQITFYGSNSALTVSGGSKFNIYHNTLFLDSPVPTGYNALAGLSPNVDSRNNLIVNYATGNGYGNWAACLSGSTSYSVTSNNNFYSKAPYNSIIVTIPVERKTMNSFHAAVGGLEMNSVLDTIIFSSVTYTTPGFMVPSPTVPTLVESGAMPISWITTDIYGNPRNPNTPDIGAIEGNYLPGLTDSVPPMFSGIGFTSGSCNLAMRTLTTQLSDPSGVSSGSLSPTIYYKVNNGTYTSSPGILTSGTPSLGIYSFTVAATVVPGDSVSWFLIAQDNASNQNIGSWPALGLSAQSVNNVSVFPSPQRYKVYMSLGGTYTVGSSGTFTSLTAAATAYNNSCLTGPVTFVLTNTMYTLPSESFPVVFKRHPDASFTNSLLIIPSPGNSVTINTGTQVASTSVIKFEDARYINFDGNNSNNARLAITCSVSSSTVSALFWMASNNTSTGGCSFIKISGTDLYGSSPEQCYGILASASHSTNLVSGGGAYNNSITVSSNRFSLLSCGIYAYGFSDLSSFTCRNWLIEGNQIGPAINSATQNLTRVGIQLQNSILTSILNNTICNITNTTSNADLRGIELATGTSSCTIAYNSIRSMSVLPGTLNSLIGINIMTDVSNAGILIHNNFISDLNTLSNSNFQYGGIILGNLSNTPGGVRIHNNSIVLNSTALTSSLLSVSGCIVLSSNNNIEIKNNILHNNVQNSGSSTRRNYCIYLGSSALSFPLTYFDHNNFSTGTEANIMGSSTAYSVLSVVQNITGQNYNSTNFTPAFVSGIDLHLNPTNPSNALLKSTGDAISLYNNDIDNDPRNTTTPDVGADEFAAASCTSASAGTILPTAYTICSTSTLNVLPSGISGGVGTLYQWQQSPTSGGTFTNITSGSGLTSPQYNPGGQLAPGIYYIRLSASCPNASLSSASNEATLTIVATPTLTISQTHTALCSGLSATLSASGALTYSWSTGATTSSIIVSPTVSTFYSVSYSNSTCGSGISNPIIIVATQAPTLSVSGPTSACSGSTLTLTASGAISYSLNGGAQTNPIVTTLTSTTVFTVSGNSGGCNSTAVLTVQALPSPTIAISGPSSICPGQTASLVASGANSFLWSNSVTSSLNVVTPASTTVYSVTGTSAGCTSSLEHTVNIVGLSPIAVSGNTSICSGQSTTLSASGYSNITWSPGGNTLTIVVSPSVNTSYTVNGSGACSNSAIVNVIVNPTPQFTISGPTGVCIGQLVTLNVSGANTFTWSNGSQTTSLSLTVLNNTILSGLGTSTAGCSGTVNYSISATAVPQLTIMPSSPTVCVFSPISYTALGANNFSWSPGNTGTVFNFTPSVSSIITVTGTSNGCNATQTLAITTSSLPVLTISPPSTIACAQSSVSFNASGAGSYTWSNSGGNNSNASYMAFGSTVYTVSGTDGLNGCIGTQTAAVTTNSLPVIAIFGPSTICSGQSATLLATGAANYLWNTTSTSPFAIISPTTSSSYLVVGTAPNGCSSSTGHTVTVVPVPVVTIVPASATVCLYSAIVFSATGANSFVWTGGPPTASISVTPTSSSIYTITGTTSGCSSSQTVAVSTLSLPILSLSPSTATVCALSPLTVSASGAASYTWSPGGGNSAIAVFTPSASTNYTLSGTDGANGCISKAIAAVTTNSLPVLSISGNSTVCAGGSTTLNAGGATSFSWSNGGTSPQVIFTPLTSTMIVINGTNAAGCSSSFTLNVMVIPNPTILVQSSASVVCALSSVTFSASGASSFTWSNGPATAGFTVTPAGPSIYTVTGTTSECSSSQTVAVSTLSLPLISLSPPSATVCVLSSVTFTASGPGTYTWSHGGGNSATASFTPSASTNYTLTGTNSVNGCTAAVIAPVSTNSLPVVSVTGNTAVCAGQSTTLNAGGASSYSWSNGSTGSQMIFTPGASTMFVVSGTTAAGCSASAIVNVLVVPLPTIQVVSSASSVCALSAVTLTASGANNYLWSTSETGSIIISSPAIPSVYTVTGVGNNGCGSTATISIGILSAPSITVSASALTVCPLSATSLTASGASNYTWTGNVTGTVITVFPSATTVYTLAGISTINGCRGTQVIQIGAFAPALISVSGNSAVCAGSSTTLTASGASSYSWSTGGSFSSSVINPTSNLQVVVTGTTINGCIGASSFAVVSLSLPVITISGSSSLCAGGTGTLSANGANSYLWSNAASSASIQITPFSTTVYSVTGTSLNSCTSVASRTVSIATSPTLSILSTSTVVCAGQQVTLTVSGGSTYTWSVGGNSTSIVVSPTSATTYSVYSGTTGCTAEATVSIASSPAPALAINPSNIFVCPQTPVSMTVSGASTYTWNGVSTGSTYSFAALSTTIIIVRGTAAVSGCTAALQTTVGTFALPLVTITGPTVLCSGISGTWQAGGANSYSWSTGHLTPSITLNPLSSATITLIGSSQQGCIGTTSLALTVQPVPLISVNPSSIVACNDDAVLLKATGATQFTWMPGGLTGAGFNAPAGSGVYTVTGTDSFGCPGNTVVVGISRDTCTSLTKIDRSDLRVQIYPNPTYDIIEVHVEGNSEKLIQIYNNLGMLILEERMITKIHSINLSHFDKGVYSIVVTTDRLKKVERLILN